MDAAKLVLVVFGGLVVSFSCTAATTTKTPTTTGDGNQTTRTGPRTTSAAATTAASSSTTAPYRTTTAAKDAHTTSDDDSDIGLGIGIGIVIALVVVAAVVAVLVTLLWRRRWILPCSTEAPAKPVDQCTTGNVKTAAAPKTYTRKTSRQTTADAAATRANNYASLDKNKPQETYEPLQTVQHSDEVYEDPGKVPAARATQRKGRASTKRESPSRSQPDGGNSSGEDQDFYQNCVSPVPPDREGGGCSPKTLSPPLRSHKHGQGGPPPAVTGTDDVYMDMDGTRGDTDSVYENTEMKSS